MLGRDTQPERILKLLKDTADSLVELDERYNWIRPRPVHRGSHSARNGQIDRFVASHDIPDSKPGNADGTIAIAYKESVTRRMGLIWYLKLCPIQNLSVAQSLLTIDEQTSHTTRPSGQNSGATLRAANKML
jgi:hypothetical protein